MSVKSEAFLPILVLLLENGRAVAVIARTSLCVDLLDKIKATGDKTRGQAVGIFAVAAIKTIQIL